MPREGGDVRRLVVEVLGTPPGVKGNSKQIVRNKITGAMFLVSSKPDRIAESALVDALLVHPSRPSSPLSGPLRLDVEAVVSVPSGWSRKKREAALSGELRPTTRPDRGNYLKLAEDALQAAGYLADDSNVVEGDVRKSYGNPPGWRFALGVVVPPAGEGSVRVD